MVPEDTPEERGEEGESEFDVEPTEQVLVDGGEEEPVSSEVSSEDNDVQEEND